MKKVKKNMSKTSDKELTEADLEKVSGGVGHAAVTGCSSSTGGGKKKSTHGTGTGQSTTGSGNPLTKSKST